MPHPAAPASTAAEIVAPLMVRNLRPPTGAARAASGIVAPNRNHCVCAQLPADRV